MADPKVLGIVLAGGEGNALSPLTLDRAKPVVPFGGLLSLDRFRVVDLVDTGVLRIAVLTPGPEPQPGPPHHHDLAVSSMGNYVTPVPAQQRLGPQWYTGSADAILPVAEPDPRREAGSGGRVGADHVYRIDPRRMIAQHLASGTGARWPAFRCHVRRPAPWRDQDRLRRGAGRGVPGEAARPAGAARSAR